MEMTRTRFVYEQYKVAIDTRKLEIELFWKRSLFFAGFIAAALIGYSSKGTPKVPIAIFGLFMSIGWFLANKGSKYWQESWEIKVAAIEECLAILFSADENIPFPDKLFQYWVQEKDSWYHLSRGSKRSVSRIAILISASIIPLWLYALLKEIPGMKESCFTLLGPQLVERLIWIFWVVYGLAAILFLLFNSSTKQPQQQYFLSRENIEFICKGTLGKICQDSGTKK